MARTRKESTAPFAELAVAVGIQWQRSCSYSARNDSRKESVIPSAETLVFLKWEFAAVRSNTYPISSHYRKLGLRLKRADVTKAGFFSVENFDEIGRIGSEAGLMVRWGALGGGNFHWLGQTKDQETPSFEANHRAFRSLGWASPAPDEKAGRLHRNI